jgi:hypothetical protein
MDLSIGSTPAGQGNRSVCTRGDGAAWCHTNETMADKKRSKLNVSANFEHSDQEESDQELSPRQVAGPVGKLLRSAHRATLIPAVCRIGRRRSFTVG